MPDESLDKVKQDRREANIATMRENNAYHEWKERAEKAEVLNRDHARQYEALIGQLREECARWETWVNDLQSGMFINCVYCGHRYGPSPETPVAMADVLKVHIEQCPKHPMSVLKARLEVSEVACTHLRTQLAQLPRYYAQNPFEVELGEVIRWVDVEEILQRGQST